MEPSKFGGLQLHEPLDLGIPLGSLLVRQPVADRSDPPRAHPHRLAERPELELRALALLLRELPGPIERLHAGIAPTTAPDLPEALVHLRLEAGGRKLDRRVQVA